MSAPVLTAPAPPPATGTAAVHRAEAAIARRTFRQLGIGALVCALVFGLTIASSALTYVNSFPTAADRAQLAATTSSDAGLAVLLGPITTVDTVGGYTVYKSYVFLTTVGAIWALLATTRVLRGEEDSGRWHLVLAGATKASRATAATLAALAAAVAVIFVGATAGTALAGLDPDVGFGVGESILYGLSLALVPAVFVTVGALTSQLARTRRLANELAMAVFGVAFVLRMVGDSGPGTRWLLWLTPFGWTERMKPFSGNNPWPLVPAAITVAVLGGAAVVLAGRRDAGGGLLASRDTAPPRPFGLGTSLGLATRLEAGVLLAWSASAAATAFVLGIIAKLTTRSIPQSLGDTLDKFGAAGTFADQYLGVAFLFVATLVALLPASQVGAAAEEETTGRAVEVLVRQPSRTAWLGGRLALAAAAVVVSATAAGAAAWAGAWTQGVDTGFWTMVGAGLNTIPVALVALGVGAVAFSVTPRAASPAVYGVILWSLVVDLFGSLVAGLGGLQRVSLFHYMALAPAEDPDPATVVLTVAAGLGLCGLALWQFNRRDLRTG